MMHKDVGEIRLDSGSTLVGSTVESHRLAFGIEQGRKCGGVPPIPALQQLPIQCPDLGGFERLFLLLSKNLGSHDHGSFHEL